MIAHRIIAAALLLGVAPFASAQTFEFGPELPMGDGAVRAFAETDGTGKATRIGLELTESAVTALAEDMIFLTVPLPEAAREAGCDHVSLDWMPHGHPPGDLFGVPHFDVHFYMVTEAEQQSIQPSDPHFMTKAANRPSVELMPADFVPPPTLEPVPAMGEHWVDSTDPVFAGQAFQAVLIYGAWDGEVIFVEPMVTRDLLNQKVGFGGKVHQPERVAKPVSLPSSWSVSFDAKTGVHRVSIDELVQRVPDDAHVKATTN